MSGKIVIFSAFLLVLGVVLIVVTSNSLNNLSGKCVSNRVLIGLNLILAIGVVLVVLPVIQFFCYNICKCPAKEREYGLILCILFFSLTFLSVIVLAGINETNCDDSVTKNSMISFSIIGGVMTLFTAYILYTIQ